MNYFVIVEIKKIVPWEVCVIPRKLSTKQLFSPWKMIRQKGFILESQLEIRNRGSTILATLFPPLYSETR